MGLGTASDPDADGGDWGHTVATGGCGTRKASGDGLAFASRGTRPPHISRVVGRLQPTDSGLQPRRCTVALTIGIDIGGTKVAAGAVDEQGGIVSSARRDTPSHDPAKIQEIIADVVRELQASHQIEAVGIGAAGFVDAARANVIFAPNLAWRDEPLRAAIEAR